MQILKDYHLYEDMSRLNHDQYFHEHFQTPELTQCLSSPSNLRQYSEQARNICIYFFNLSHTIDKNVFVLLKWMIVAHDIIKGVQYYRVMREMQEALSLMGEAKMESKYDRYLFDRLIKPYKHYLQKLCILLGEANNSVKGGNKNNKSAQDWFMKYNLVKYGLYEFCPVLIQFIGFFKENYPFLAKLAIEIGADIEKFLKELKSEYKMYQVKFVEKHELEEFQQSFSRMSEIFPSKPCQSLCFTESQFCSGKLYLLFESGSKVQGSILFTSGAS